MKIVFRVGPNAVCNFYDCILFFYFTFWHLWPLSQIFKVTKYFRLIAIVNLVYIIVFTLHIFNFWRGSKSANGGPNLLVDLDPRGSISTSRFGPGGPNLLVDMDRGSKSTGVQINRDTGMAIHTCLVTYIYLVTYTIYVRPNLVVLVFVRPNSSYVRPKLEVIGHLNVLSSQIFICSPAAKCEKIWAKWISACRVMMIIGFARKSIFSSE